MYKINRRYTLPFLNPQYYCVVVVVTIFFFIVHFFFFIRHYLKNACTVHCCSPIFDVLFLCMVMCFFFCLLLFFLVAGKCSAEIILLQHLNCTVTVIAPVEINKVLLYQMKSKQNRRQKKSIHNIDTINISN